MEIGVIAAISVILEIGKFGVFGSTSDSTSGSTSDPFHRSYRFLRYFTSKLSATFQKTTIIIIIIRRRNDSNIQLVSLLCKSRERKVIVIESSHDNNYEAKDIHLIATRFN